MPRASVCWLESLSLPLSPSFIFLGTFCPSTWYERPFPLTFQSLLPLSPLGVVRHKVYYFLSFCFQGLHISWISTSYFYEKGSLSEALFLLTRSGWKPSNAAFSSCVFGERNQEFSLRILFHMYLWIYSFTKGPSPLFSTFPSPPLPSQ